MRMVALVVLLVCGSVLPQQAIASDCNRGIGLKAPLVLAPTLLLTPSANKCNSKF